jgi:hypothetical protein
MKYLIQEIKNIVDPQRRMSNIAKPVLQHIIIYTNRRTQVSKKRQRTEKLQEE